jgi:hypothetical protein
MNADKRGFRSYQDRKRLRIPGLIRVYPRKSAANSM